MNSKEKNRLDVILASASPRRRDLLREIVPDFRVVPSRVDEDLFRDRDPVVFARRAAIAKARAVGAEHPSSLIIAADTVVCCDEDIFGKPKSRREAESMLERLSRKRHRVVTAVALYREDQDRMLSGQATSWVTFKMLSRADIEKYLDANDFLDKAGSYAIQESGDALVRKLEGDYDNVVGLPIRLLRELLTDFLNPRKTSDI
ncbi:MAG: Maf family protein [Candidatus Aminicenantales bacterium]